MTRLRSLALTLSTLALAACAAGPDYVAPVPPPLATTGPFLSAEEGVVAPTPLPASWWRLYDDPVLDRLVADALVANTDVRQATARVAQARAGLRGARAGRLPSTGVSVSASYARQSQADLAPGADRDGMRYDGGLAVSYEVDLFGRVGRSVEAASADFESAQADADAVRVLVVAETTRAYADAASAAARLAVAQDIVRLLDASVTLTERRRDAGVESGLAVAQLATLREQRAAEIPTLLAERQAALFALATLTGRTPAALPPIAGERSVALSISEPLPVGDGAALLARRPDIRAAERRLAADTARIGVATADLYPRVSLGGSVGASASSLGNLFSGGALGLLVGPLVDWAFPNTEAARARIEAAEAGARGSLAAFDGTVLTALQEAETALNAYARALDRRRALAAAQTAAERAVQITRARQREGVIAPLELLDAERSLAETRAALADQDATISRTQIDVFLALGGGWSPPSVALQQGSAARQQ